MKFLLILLLSTLGYSHIEAEESIVKNQETFELKVIITDVRAQSGLVLLGIYNKPENYLKSGNEYSFTIHKAKVIDNQIEIIFKDIPKGTYAISLCHDVNADHKCNSNFLGIPVEPYGFSNGYNRRLSKPSFNDCKFEVTQNRTVKVQLIH